MSIALRHGLSALALSALVPGAPALACSVVSSYRVPSNFELVQGADLILLGIAADHDSEEGRYNPQGEVIVRPTGLIKGDSLPPEVRLNGYLADDPRLIVYASDPRDLVKPNEGTLTGACRRYVFKRGMLLVLFLKRDDGGRLRLVSSPFARTAEDVPSPDSLWVKAVRLYAEVGALPEPQRRAALERRRDTLRAATGDPDAGLLADDIDRQLRAMR